MKTFRPKLWWRLATTVCAVYLTAIAVWIAAALLAWPPDLTAVVLILFTWMLPLWADYLAVSAWTSRVMIRGEEIRVKAMGVERSLLRVDAKGWTLDEPNKLRRFSVVSRTGESLRIPVATAVEPDLLAWLEGIPNLGQHEP